LEAEHYGEKWLQQPVIMLAWLSDGSVKRTFIIVLQSPQQRLEGEH
jgi:hypothetical protein